MLSHQQINDLTIHPPVKFVGFHKFGDLKIYERHLPHWRQEGATYFVTFRQADSIPRNVAAELRDENNRWKRRLEEKENIPLELQLEYDAFLQRYRQIIETSLDECHGSCLFRKPENRHILANALRHFNEIRYEISSFVIMPNHCHLVIRPFEGFALEEIIGSWKKFTSRRITGALKPIWRDESHDRILRNEEHFRRAVRYILKNPLKADLAGTDYEYYLADADLTALESRLTH